MKIDYEEIHNLIGLWNNGWSASRLARWYHTTERTIWKRLRQARQAGWTVRTCNDIARGVGNGKGYLVQINRQD